MMIPDMWGEIMQWEHGNKGTLWDQCTTMSTKAIKACVKSTGARIPASVTNTIRSTVEKGKLCINILFN